MRKNSWTNKEIEILKTYYPIYGINSCVDKLNRTKRAIQLKRVELNLPVKTPIKDKWQKNNLLEIVMDSMTYHECLVKLGINNKGSSYNTLKKYIKMYDINIDHFDNSINMFNLIKGNTIKLVDILVENSTYKSTTNLKERLYKEGLKERLCEKCGQDEYWNGEKMSLILDHINGINNDNRIENLRIVCPNCNATLPTHCKGNKRIYEEKQNEIKKDKIKIINIKNGCLKRRKVERPPYEQLIKEIEELGYKGTGRKYSVSDNSIRKWIKYYENYKLN